MNPRNEMPPDSSYCRASSATCRALASTCSPARRSAKPTCARVASNNPEMVSATARRLRRKGICDGLKVRGQVRRYPEGMKDLRVAVAILEQFFVTDREERAAERREDRQLIIRPFDR